MVNIITPSLSCTAKHNLIPANLGWCAVDLGILRMTGRGSQEITTRGLRTVMAKAGKGEDLIKYITQRVVTYMDTPVEARRERQMERKNRAKESWQTKWFGMVPFGVKMWVGKWGSASKPLLKRARELNMLRLLRKQVKTASNSPSSGSGTPSQP